VAGRSCFDDALFFGGYDFQHGSEVTGPGSDFGLWHELEDFFHGPDEVRLPAGSVPGGHAINLPGRDDGQGHDSGIAGAKPAVLRPYADGFQSGCFKESTFAVSWFEFFEKREHWCFFFRVRGFCEVDFRAS